MLVRETLEIRDRVGGDQFQALRDSATLPVLACRLDPHFI